MGHQGGWACVGVFLLLAGCGPGETVLEEVAEDDALEVQAALSGGDTRWVRTGDGFSDARHIAVDAQGNTQVATIGEAGTRFGELALTNDGASVVSYSPSGRVRWVRGLGCAPAPGDAATTIEDLAVDRQGRTYVVLSANCAADFGTGRLSGRLSLVALDEEGSVRWARVLVALESPTTVNGPVHVTVSGTGQVVVALQHFGPLVISGVRHAATGLNAVLARYGATGTYLGARDVPEALMYDAQFDSAGRLLALFSVVGRGDIGGGPIDAGRRPLVVARYASASGPLLWTSVIAGEFPRARLATHGNRVVLAGEFQGELTFLGNRYTAPPPSGMEGSGRGFVLALTRTAGEPRWIRLRGRTMLDLATDARGGVTVVGFFGTLGPKPSPSDTARFVARYGRVSGTPRWVRAFDEVASVTAVAAGPTGAPRVCGTLSGTYDFGTGPITASADLSAFILRLVP